jgi:hypothetical protein
MIPMRDKRLKQRKNAATQTSKEKTALLGRAKFKVEGVGFFKFIGAFSLNFQLTSRGKKIQEKQHLPSKQKQGLPLHVAVAPKNSIFRRLCKMLSFASSLSHLVIQWIRLFKGPSNSPLVHLNHDH